MISGWPTFASCVMQWGSAVGVLGVDICSVCDKRSYHLRVAVAAIQGVNMVEMDVNAFYTLQPSEVVRSELFQSPLCLAIHPRQDRPRQRKHLIAQSTAAALTQTRGQVTGCRVQVHRQYWCKSVIGINHSGRV